MASPTTSHVFILGSQLYEQYRVAYVNGNVPAKYPREIHVPINVAGVAEAVRRAAKLGVAIGVRSGGHLFPCTSLQDGGILIDMSHVNRHVNYDPQTHLVDFGSAVRVKEAAFELRRHQRFFPTGHAPTVALGGFCLAGGQGWFMRGWGATINQWIMKLEIVTPSGDIVLADQEHHTDLFWAARGGGQFFFGVITRIWGRTIPARQLFHRTLLFRVDALFEELLAYAFEQNKKTPKYGTETAVLTFYADKYNPAATGDEVSNDSLLMAIEAITYVDTIEEAETILCAWSNPPPSLKKGLIQDDPVRPTTWEELFAAQDALVPWGNGERWICDSILNDPDVEQSKLLHHIKPAMCNLPTRTSAGCIYIGDTYPDERDAVFSLPQQYYISTFVGSRDRAQDASLRCWIQNAYREAEKVACGMYVADYDHDNRRTAVFTPTALARFLEIKKHYDPNDRFPWPRETAKLQKL